MRPRARRLCSVAVLVAAVAVGGLDPRAQAAGPPEACTLAEPGAPYRIYLLTSTPGDSVFSAFGHSALLISGGPLPAPIVADWGAFNGKDPELLPKFLNGTLEYWMAAEPLSLTLRRHEREERGLVGQELDIGPEDSERLKGYLEQASKPENRNYTYHWFDKNCSTQLRDLLDTATHGALSAAAPREPVPGRTIRGEVLRHLAPDRPVWFAWHFMASARAEAEISEWESMFLPVRMMEVVGRARASAPDRPLVRRVCSFRDSPRGMAAETAPRRDPLLWLLGGLFGGLFGLGARGRWARPLLAGGLALLGLLAGGLGTAVLALWSVTALEGVGPTLGWAVGSPLTLVVGLGGAALVGLGRRSPALGALLVGLVLIGLIGLLLVPVVGQDAVGPIGLFLLPTVGLAIGYRRSARGTHPDLRSPEG